MEDGSATRSQTHKEVIDLETQPSYRTGASSARSSQSHTQNGQWRLGLSEFLTVEDGIRPNKTRRRISCAPNGQTSKSAGQPERSEGKQQKIFKLVETHDGDLSDDPIDDDGDAVQVIDPNITMEVRVELAKHPLPYKGIGLHEPASESVATARRGSTIGRKTTETASRFFPSYGNNQSIRRSVRSNSEVEVADPESGRTTRQNGVSNQKKGVSRPSKTQEAQDVSEAEDELNIKASPQRQIADDLLAQRNQLKGLSSKVKKREHQPDQESDYSDEQLKKADMIQTISKKRKQNQVSKKTFRVHQLFSQREAWLLHGQDQPWQLVQDLDSGVLSFFDNTGHRREDLSLESKFFTSMDYITENGKLVIRRPLDSTFKGGDKICLELADSDESWNLINNARRISNSISGKLVPNLNKIFEKVLSEQQKSKRKLDEEPADLQAAKRSLKTRIEAKFDKAQEAKQSGLKMKDQMGIGQHEELPSITTRRLVQNRYPPPSNDVLDLDLGEPFRPAKAAGKAEDNPHSTRSRIASREIAPRQLQKSRSPSPDRWTEHHPNWAEDFNWKDSIIYPEKGKHKATVDKQDIQRLDEGEYLNDNLIMFYLLKLEQDLLERDPALSKRVYFHNTFFYAGLTKAVKGKRGINYEAVERWTAKVNLFSYDYIVVPVNENNHWYLAIIYNAPKLVKPEPDITEVPQPDEMSSQAKSLQSNTDATNVSTLVSSPRLPVQSPSETDVGAPLRQLSLDDPEQSNDSPRNNLSVKRQLDSGDLDESDLQPIEERHAQEAAADIANARTAKPITAVKRGRKKSSTPALRKFSPKEPKIITLDSLGMNHSPTCTNLRDYLVAEGKAKLDVVIDPPQLGMTAIGIPLQRNCCDCGLYLLSYVEAFLQNPDGFTENLLAKNKMEDGHVFEKAPSMRIRIRELLFKLQEQLVTQKPKNGKGKKSLKAQREELPPPAESGSREASNSTRQSTEPDRPKSGRLSAQPECSTREPAQDPSQRSPQTKKPGSQLPRSERHERNTNGHKQPTKQGPVSAGRSASQKPITIANDSPSTPKADDQSKGLVAQSVSVVTGIDKSFKSSGLTQPGSSSTNAVKIEDDSPHKVDNSHQSASGANSPLAQLQGHLSSPSPDVEESRHTLQNRHTTFSSRQKLRSPQLQTQVEGRLTSPSPNRSPAPDSSPLLPAAEPPSNIIDMTGDDSQLANDEEMLLPPPPLLENSSSPKTPVSTSKQTSATSPQRARARKMSLPNGSQSQPSANARQRSPDFVGRDSSDNAIIGRGIYKGTPRKFR